MLKPKLISLMLKWMMKCVSQKHSEGKFENNISKIYTK